MTPEMEAYYTKKIRPFIDSISEIGLPETLRLAREQLTRELEAQELQLEATQRETQRLREFSEGLKLP